MSQALKIYFSHLPNWLFLGLLALGLTYILQTGALWQYWYISLVLLALTPLIEYFTHKYVLHMPRPAQAEKQRFWALLANRIHYLHHEDPKVVKHVFAELWFTLPALTFYTLLTYALSRSLPVTAVFITTLIAYFLFYEWVHFIAHFDGYTPHTAYGRYMKKFHLWHHYKNESYWMGITSPVADWLFGSWPNPREIQPSELALRNRGRI